ncbi:DUF4032 domain-containing protein [Solicola gregarius]|uniref:DUF4032 domain-containing protein n=1 Tax=Solicola gregarius TaxID=2908642 RepID=A0AA46YLE4_9ACTN|nr:DUF4032 domain-containing protein [Solicola gregarius]UYM06840.1 DUF4032 domain-containing protein [Solicola gregarius]
MSIRLRATRPDPALIRLPWNVPLADWDPALDVPLARGISRHVVRFVRAGDTVVAVKETRESFANREYGLLRNLDRIGVPAVKAVAVVTGRETPVGEPIEPALVTRVLPQSLPYRSLFSHKLREDTLERVIDALVLLLVRLHLEGFYWGDCSLSNVLFRRNTDELEAYLVDAETGELHENLSDGQRAYDIDLLRTNAFGELLDLQAGGMLGDEDDAVEIVDQIVQRYEGLWEEITGIEEFGLDEMWRIQQRIERLNERGFDVEEIDIVTDLGGDYVRIQPKVLDAGHHCRRLRGLTGLDVPDSQARRLLNDLDAYTASHELGDEDSMTVAHQWLTQVYQPLEEMIPTEYTDVVETPQVFHDVLVHRWALSEAAGHEVDFFETARSYIENELPATVETLRTAAAAT